MLWTASVFFLEISRLFLTTFSPNPLQNFDCECRKVYSTTDMSVEIKTFPFLCAFQIRSAFDWKFNDIKGWTRMNIAQHIKTASEKQNRKQFTFLASNSMNCKFLFARERKRSDSLLIRKFIRLSFRLKCCFYGKIEVNFAVKKGARFKITSSAGEIFVKTFLFYYFDFSIDSNRQQ